MGKPDSAVSVWWFPRERLSPTVPSGTRFQRADRPAVRLRSIGQRTIPKIRSISHYDATSTDLHKNLEENLLELRAQWCSPRGLSSILTVRLWSGKVLRTAHLRTRRVQQECSDAMCRYLRRELTDCSTELRMSPEVPDLVLLSVL